jgi:RsiW-degrading membrane proteinase PrsW (M82 family)
MPRPDPIPPQRSALMRRFWRIFRLLALLSMVVAATAVLFVTQGERTPIHVIIATALGAGLTVLLGTALMTLVFLSAESGYDEPPHIEEESEEE